MKMSNVGHHPGASGHSEKCCRHFEEHAGQFWHYLFMLAQNFVRKNAAIQTILMDIKQSMIYGWSDQEKNRQSFKYISVFSTLNRWVTFNVALAYSSSVDHIGKLFFVFIFTTKRDIWALFNSGKRANNWALRQSLNLQFVS